MNWEENFRENPKLVGVLDEIFISLHSWKNSCHSCHLAGLARSDPSFEFSQRLL